MGRESWLLPFLVEANGNLEERITGETKIKMGRLCEKMIFTVGVVRPRRRDKGWAWDEIIFYGASAGVAFNRLSRLV